MPIVLYQKKIIDGRHRARACRELGIKPSTEEYDGDDPLGHVVSLNVNRRHLNASQRAMIALDLVNTQQGERTDLELSVNLPKVGQIDAAAMMRISEKQLRSAKKSRKKAPPNRSPPSWMDR